MVKSISSTNGTPTLYLPLVFIILLSMLKDILEDIKRHKSDKEENIRNVEILKENKFENSQWKDLRVGNIIKVTNIIIIINQIFFYYFKNKNLKLN